MGTLKQKTYKKLSWEHFLSDLTSKKSERAVSFPIVFPKKADPGSSLICDTFARRRKRKRTGSVSILETEPKSCCMWTLDKFKKRICFDDLLELNTATTEVTLHYSVKSITDKKLAIFQINAERPEISDVLSTESNVRILINFVLQKLRGDLKFGIRTEVQKDPDSLPTCKFDYLVFNHCGQPIGCVETKSSSTMNCKAFVQAVLELLVLQKVASEENVDVRKVPLFNILTDGLRFVLLQVKGDKLLVEQNEDNKLKIHTARVNEHVLQEQNEESQTDGVMESLYRLIQMSVNASLEK